MAYQQTLTHHGIKGMKWGIRRYQTKDGDLTPAGIKRYAKKGYSQDAYNSNKSVAGKTYDKVTGSHKIAGSMKYDMSSKSANKARAERYVSEQNSKSGVKVSFRSNATPVGRALSTVSKVSDAVDTAKTVGKTAKELGKIAKDSGAGKIKNNVTPEKARSAASNALDKLDDKLFFDGDNIPNNFAIRAGIREVKRGLDNGDSVMNSVMSGIKDYEFFKD